MKKFFTLIVMALMAVGVNAQSRSLLWEGQKEMDGSWPSVQIASSEFATAAVGDKIVVTVSKADNSINSEWQWGPQVFINVDWKSLKDTSAASLKESTEAQETSFEITADGLAQIKAASEVEVQGMNVVVSKIELESSVPTTSSSFWEGEVNFGSWANALEIEAEKFATISEGDGLEFVYTTTENKEQNWYQFKFEFNGTTDLLASVPNLNEYGCASVALGSTKFKFTLNAADAATLKEKGMKITGKDIILTQINIIKVATGITAVKTAQQDGVRYNLAGQKVNAGYKGVVIMNGKKFVVK